MKKLLTKGIIENLEEKGIPKNDNPPKEILYECEWGMLVGICPNCNEIPYSEKVCQFCGQKLIWKEKPKKYQDIVVKKDDYVITQIYGSWSVYVEKNGELISHSICKKRLTKKELLKFARERNV